MNLLDIATTRLSNQKLLGNSFTTTADAVLYLGGLQAQDYQAAKWSLGQRIENASDEMIEQDFNEGKILRTHVMRPTWHFVSPENIRWMLELTAPRVKRFMGTYNRKLELTDAVFEKCNKVIAKALEKDNKTRAELKEQLAQGGIETDVQRLGHIVMNAELDGIICSGPRKGKQFTYALLEKRVKKMKRITREEALAKLALTYFMSHGPAQIIDFTWWSGLTMKDANEGLDSVKSILTNETVENKIYWFSPDLKINRQNKTTAYLLSIFDEYTIAYKDRSALGGERYIEKFISMGSALLSVIILDGKVVGTWKRILKKAAAEVKLSVFAKLNDDERGAVEKAADDYGKFLGLRVLLSGL